MMIKRRIIKPVKEIGITVFYFKRTKESTYQNSIVLAAFNGKLGEEMETQKGNPLEKG